MKKKIYTQNISKVKEKCTTSDQYLQCKTTTRNPGGNLLTLYANISYPVDHYEPAGKVYLLHTTPLQVILNAILSTYFMKFHNT